MMISIDFHLLGLSLILLHELDAIRCKEWRIFPGLSMLSDRLGMIVFLFAHIPLFYWILYKTIEGDAAFQYGMNVFLIIHMGLHLLFLMHQKNEFKDGLSWLIIVGAALCGFIDIALG